MAHEWDVLGEAERVRWQFTPLVGVGPVRFDMTCEQVAEAVADVFPRINKSRVHHNRNELTCAIFSPLGRRWGGAITTYYDDQGLAGVAAHARLGPQVTLFGMDLVCRVPSQIEDEFADKAEVHGYELRYGQRVEPGSGTLGIVLRTERAGDYARSRPVFVAERWSDMCCDSYTGPLPQAEWHTFLS